MYIKYDYADGAILKNYLIYYFENTISILYFQNTFWKLFTFFFIKYFENFFSLVFSK